MTTQCELESIARSICCARSYSYVTFIDAGAFKETYKVCFFNENYALKVFKPHNRSERIKREIDAMKRINCDKVSRLVLVDSIIHDDIEYLYLIEEFIAGGSLRMILKESILSNKEVLCLGNDLICALESMYKERIVHRDIKPDNVMFRDNHVNAVLVDFGLVRDLEASSLTQAFHIRGPGTPLYSAPEQLNNQKAMIDWRTDQFSLGITLCEAMLGIHPFDAGSPAQTVEKIAALEKCNDTTSMQLNESGFKSLLKMLEPYPINRYRTPELLRINWNRRI